MILREELQETLGREASCEGTTVQFSGRTTFLSVRRQGKNLPFMKRPVSDSWDVCISGVCVCNQLFWKILLKSHFAVL